MLTTTLLQVLTSVGAGLLGGVVVAIINQMFARRKTAAETKKLEAETEKTRVETQIENQKLLAEMQRIASSVQEVSYKLSQGREKIIYDVSNHGDGADFSGQGERFFGESNDKPKGAGQLKVENGVLNLQRTNNGGRFRIILQRYLYVDIERDYIPKNDLIAGKRLLKLTCDVKVVGGVHTAVFIVKKKQDGDHLAKHEQTFIQNEWVSVEAYLRIPPNAECFLVIDDQGVSQANSSLQLRKLILAERESGTKL